MENFNSLIEAIDQYRSEGYLEDFNLKPNSLECTNGNYELLLDQFKIDKYYRFEQNTDPDDESIIYAISSYKYSVKGILINSYGIYSEPINDEMLSKLHHT